MKILEYLVKEPGKTDDIAETIALAGGGDFQITSYLKLSGMNKQSMIAKTNEGIRADVEDCTREITELEALKQNRRISLPEVANPNGIKTQDLQEGKQKEFSDEQTIEESLRRRVTLDPSYNISIDAKEFLSGKIVNLPEPYLIVRDSPTATFQNIMGVTFNNLAAVINILARKHNYRIISTACDNHTMYVFMEKVGSLR
jgi:hypothetical protein